MDDWDLEPPGVKRRAGGRMWPGFAGAALVLLLVGALAGYFIARSQLNDNRAMLMEAREQVSVLQKAVSQAEERIWNYYQENQVLVAQVEELQRGPDDGDRGTPTTAVPGPRTTYGDGTYLVGTQIPPGDYTGVVTGQVGYWARLRSTDGVIGAIIANGLPRGPFVLTINQSDMAVELRGVKITSR